MSVNNADENGINSTSQDHLNLDDFTKNGFTTLTAATRHSNALPANTDWNFYKFNESFCRITNSEGDRLARLINSILRSYEIDESVNSRKSIKDKVELIVEANDMILEKVGDNLDELDGIKKKSVQPVEFQTVTAELPTISGSWNRINRATYSVSPSANSPKVVANSPKAIHLLTGKNIIRPQTFFKDKIDNSNNYPWQPGITEKSNSIRPLALFLEETEFGDAFCHPYQTELDQFEPPPDQLKAETPIEPKPILETPLHKIQTPEKLNELVEDLRKHSIIAIDLEHHSYRTFLGITCLMQISTIDADYIIDTLELRDKLHILNEVFTKPSIIKVFHGADSDIPWLQRDLALYIVNMFDTHQAAKQLGYSGLSLAYLLQRFCKFIPNKQFQLADWRIRPLPDELISYAREDTHYLIYLYGMLKNELLKQGNGKDNILRSVIQKSTEICKKRYFKPILTNESHLDFYRKCKRLFDNKQMFALKELYHWRDGIAREEDESTGYVLPNHMLLQIAEVLPREMQGILACCNPIPPLVRSHLLELHQIVLKAREQSSEKPIMKEDNRSVGSTQQFSKINIDSSLHCPHDLTKQSEFRDDLPVLISHVPMTGDTWTNKYDSNTSTALEKPKSEHSVFDTPERSVEEESNCPIKFLSPFERYKMVKPFVQAEEEKEKTKKNNEVEDKSTDDRIASLHEHFLKVAKKCPPNGSTSEETERSTKMKDKVIPEIIPLGKTETIVETEPSKKRVIEEAQPLSHMQGVKRKRYNITPVILDPNFDTPSNPLLTPVPKIDNITVEKRQTPFKRKRKPRPAAQRNQPQQIQNAQNVRDRNFAQRTRANAQNAQGNGDVKSKKKKKNKNKKKGGNGGDNGGNNQFKPFDYSSLDYSQFQGGAGSSGNNKKKNFGSKFKGKNRKPGGKRNNKFSTFNDKKVKI